jgi:hypothetical protein
MISRTPPLTRQPQQWQRTSFASVCKRAARRWSGCKICKLLSSCTFRLALTGATLVDCRRLVRVLPLATDKRLLPVRKSTGGERRARQRRRSSRVAASRLVAAHAGRPGSRPASWRRAAKICALAAGRNRARERSINISGGRRARAARSFPILMAASSRRRRRRRLGEHFVE